jgi:hypothetical protein
MCPFLSQIVGPDFNELLPLFQAPAVTTEVRKSKEQFPVWQSDFTEVFSG